MYNFISNVNKIDKQDYQEGELLDDDDEPQKESSAPKRNKSVSPSLQQQQEDVVYETIPVNQIDVPRKKQKKQYKIESKSNKSIKRDSKDRHQSPMNQRVSPFNQPQPMNPPPMYGQQIPGMYAPKQMPFYPMVNQYQGMPMMYSHHYPPTHPYPYMQGPPNYPYPGQQNWIPNASKQPLHQMPITPMMSNPQQIYQTRKMPSPVRLDPRKEKIISIKTNLKKNLEGIKQKQQLLYTIRKLVKDRNNQKVLDKIATYLEQPDEKIKVENIMKEIQMGDILKKIKEKKLTEKLLEETKSTKGITKIVQNIIKDPRKQRTNTI